jgi:hypothetical protein
MRQSYQNIEWIKSGKEILGINLGFDFCSEHEWGIKDLQRILEIPKLDENNAGYDSRKINSNKNIFTWEKSFTSNKVKKTWYFVLCSSLYRELDSYKEDFLKKMKYHASYIKHAEIYSEWSESGFFFSTTNKEGYEVIKKATENMTLCIGSGISKNPFSRGGLVLIDMANLDEESKQELKEKDIDALKLTKCSEDILKGLQPKLDAAQKTYYALSPSWKEDNQKTKYDVVYWLNPRNQQENNYGWFTVEDLELWANNEGPIIKSKN